MEPFIYVHLLSDGGAGIYLGCADKSAVEASAESEGFDAQVIPLFKASDVESLQGEIDTLREALKDVQTWIEVSASRTVLEKIVKDALNK